jgi:hypothetical protein
LVGAAVAMRGNLVSIAVLSLIGANIAPLLVATDDAPIVPFLSYLLAMQLVALLLAQWGTGGKWWTLRGLSIVPQVFWMCEILGGRHGHEPAICAFLVVYAIFYHAELILAALRGQAGRFAGSAMAIATTAAFVAGLLCYLAEATSTLRGDWVMTVAVISAGLGLMLPRIDEKLGRLAIAHRIAAAALLALWVPIATSGIRVEVGWMVLAIVFAAMWSLTASSVSRVAAPITWVLGLAALALSAMDHGVGNAWLTISSTSIGSNIVLAWLFALSGHLIATLIGLNRQHSANNAQWETTARLIGLLSALIWLGASIGGLPPLGATASIIAYAWVLLGGEIIGVPGGLGEIAFAALVIATIKWAAVDTLNARLSSDWTTTRPVFNPLMGVSAAAVVSLLAFSRWLKKPLERLPDSRLCLAAAVIGLMTLGFSFEIDRVVGRIEAAGWQYAMNPWEVRQLSWTILWSLALTAVMFAVRRNVRWMNGVWAIILLPVGKFILLDTIWPLLSERSVATPILNLDFLAGASVLGCISIARILLSARGESAAITRFQIPNLAAFLVGWMGTLEIARFVARLNIPSESTGFEWHLKNLGWTMWWTVVAGSALWLGWRSDRKAGRNDIHAPWLTVWPVVLAAIAVKFLGIDAINWRMEHVPVSGWPVLLNLDILTALIVIGGLVLPCRLSLPAAALDAGYGLRLRKSAATLSVAILLVNGSLEVDRLFHIVSVFNPELAEQFGLSIFWSSFAVLTLACGFWRRVASLRYFSLALLAITLLKVVVIDLSQVGYGYRVLSFIGLGLLLLGTSVMYGKVSPMLLRQVSAKE